MEIIVGNFFTTPDIFIFLVRGGRSPSLPSDFISCIYLNSDLHIFIYIYNLWTACPCYNLIRSILVSRLFLRVRCALVKYAHFPMLYCACWAQTDVNKCLEKIKRQISYMRAAGLMRTQLIEKLWMVI